MLRLYKKRLEPWEEGDFLATAGADNHRKAPVNLAVDIPFGQ
jgi:hypothetical protein